MQQKERASEQRGQARNAAAMQQLGKVMNPMTNKIERDLEQAQGTIAMMKMLQTRTAGNLEEDEQKLLERLLFELQMNYVDEAKEDENAGTEQPDAGKTDRDADNPAGGNDDSEKDDSDQ